jgi:hypothetical protein
VLLCVIVTLFVVTLAGAEQRQAVFQSRSGYYIARLLDKADAVMPGELQQVIDPFVKKLEEGVQPPPDDWALPQGLEGGQEPGAENDERIDERSRIAPEMATPEGSPPLRPLPSDRWRR